MDISAVQGVVASLKAATDISKAFLDLKTTAEVQGKVIELQSALLAAQSAALEATNAQFSLQQRVNELEASLKNYDDWAAQERRYVLFAPWKGPAQVYALLSAEAKGQDPHYLCTNCFHNRKRVILAPTSKDGWVHMVCPACKASLATGYRGIGGPKYPDAPPSED